MKQMNLTNPGKNLLKFSLASWVTKAVFLLMVSMLFMSVESQATHFRYGHLTWQKSGTNTVRFTLVDAFRRGYGPSQVGDIIQETIGGTALDFGDGNVTPTLFYRVIAIDPVENWLIGQALQPGDTSKHYIEHTYSGPTQLGGDPWLAQVNTSARTSTEQNNPDGAYRLLTYVELTSGNTSPSSSLPPIVALVQRADATFIIPGADPDASSYIRFRLATSAEAAGFGTFNQPAGLVIDSVTGVVTWNTLGTVLGGLYSCQVILEDHDVSTGALRTQVPVDFLIEIVECDPANRVPAFIAPTPANGNVFSAQVGQLLTFTVAASDSDAQDEVDLNTGGLPIGATANPGLPTAGNPVSTDFSWTPAPGSPAVNIVTFFATDNCGTQSITSVTINVAQCTTPDIACPGNIVVSTAPGACNAAVTYPVIAVTGSPTPTVSYSIPSGSTFNKGTTAVKIYATNDCGTDSCTFTVTVNDNQAPTINCPANITKYTPYASCGQPSACSAIATYCVTFGDNCPGATIQQIAGLPSGSAFPRGTTINTFKVTDASGNCATCSFNVCVIDNQRPIANCRNVTVCLVNGVANVTAAQVNNGSYDNCGIASMTLSRCSFTCANIGCNSVTLTVKDAAGNTSTCCATVTVTGSKPTCSLSATPCNNTYTGGNPTKIYLGYGPQSATLNVNVTGGGAPYTYAWTGSYLSANTGAHPVFAPTAPGTYCIGVTVTNASGCTSTCSITFCVMDIRVAGTSGSGCKVWICHAQGCSPANQQVLISQVPSHIGCHSSDRLGKCGQGCGPARMAATGEMTFEDENSELEMMVYPNPFTSNFRVRFENAGDEIINLRLFNMAGQTIQTLTDQLPSGEFILGNDLGAGIYFLEVQQGEFRKVVKVNKAD